MQDHQDAYGHAMLDYLGGKRSAELAAIGCTTWFSSFGDWFGRERQAIALVRGRVLDVGCGAGRHALYLQERSHEVMAIDASPLAVEVSRQRGVRDARVLRVTQVSSRLGRFDTVLMLGNNAGLLANRKRAVWLLRRLRAMTSNGGRLLAGSGDAALSGNGAVRAEMDLNRRRGRMSGQIRRRGEYGPYRTPWFDWLCLSESEMSELAAAAHWRVSQFLHDDTTAYVAVLEK